MSDAGDAPYAPLASLMRVDVLANATDGIWVLHDKPLPDILKWVDYDPLAETMSLAYQDGRTQEIGLIIGKAMAAKFSGFSEITVMLMEEGLVADFAMVPLNIGQP